MPICFGQTPTITSLIAPNGHEVVFLGKLSAAPTGLSTGKAYIYYNTTNNVMYGTVDAGVTWIVMYSGPVGWSSRTLVAGDITYGTISGGPLAGTFNSGTFKYLPEGDIVHWNLQLDITITVGAVGYIYINDGLTLAAGVPSGFFQTAGAVQVSLANGVELAPMSRDNLANDWVIRGSYSAASGGNLKVYAHGTIYNAP